MDFRFVMEYSVMEYSLTQIVLINNMTITRHKQTVPMSKENHSSDKLFGFDFPEVLQPDVYKELRMLAARYMNRQGKHRTLQTTVLVHEAWLRLSRQGRKWRDRDHFFATASVTMRRILIDYARRKSRQRHGGGLRRISSVALHDLAAPDRTEGILQIDEGITELEKSHPERARVVVDRFFGGMTNQEIAESLGISERSVERHWAMAKVWLLRWIQQSAPTHELTVA
jgi:RNA polymerase sigma factor (TIGR02999 family)